MTEAQVDRQTTRKSGKYSKMNECELCKKGCGHNYYSDDRCNKYGVGLTLHSKCLAKVENLDDVQYLMSFGETEAQARATIADRQHRESLWRIQNT